MNEPFLLTPFAKDYIWGGSRLNDDFNLNIPVSPFAEAWVCSTHPDGESRVLATDQLLSEALKEHPEWLGTHPLQIMGDKPELPILIKFIDAAKDLSVQVHPDDDYASRVENSLGKTEVWYVLDAAKGASIIYGFKHDVSKELVRKAIDNGTIGRYLNRIPVEKDELYYMGAGTVHAIGAGCLLVEVQESSNLTYRMYDYDRIDKNGKKRPLHIDKALDVANLESSSTPRQPMRVLKYRNGTASELLTRCKYFQIERFLLNTEVQRDLATFRTEKNSFHVLLCFDGCGVLFGEGISIPFFKGDCIFVPADSMDLKLHGKAQLLNISC